MEEWTEDNLAKLSVKELKSLARKSNVNSNLKKAELVKALLTNGKNVADCCETDSTLISKRVTRSRVSIWQTSNETLTCVKENKNDLNEGNVKLQKKCSVGDKRGRKKLAKEVHNSDINETSEMFPLVSSIQLASKPLVEITNKGIVDYKENKQDELHPVVTHSKRSKRNKVQVNIEMDPVVNPCLSAESITPKEDDLNATFTVEYESIPQEINKSKENIQKRENKDYNEGSKLNPSNPVINYCDDSKMSKETQQDVQFPTNVRNKTFKQRRGKKRKSDSLEEIETAPKIAAIPGASLENSDSHCLNKKKRKKFNEGNSIENLARDDGNFSGRDVSETTNKINSGLSDSEMVKIKKFSISNKTEFASVEGKTRKSLSIQNSTYIAESTTSDTNENVGLPPKSTKSVSVVLTNVVSTVVKPVGDKVRGAENKKQVFSLERISNAQEATKSTEISLNNSLRLQRSLRKTGSISIIENEPTVENNLVCEKNVMKTHDNTNGNILEDKDTSAIQGETGDRATPVPIRSSTFILSSVAGETEAMPVSAPRRDATFVLSDQAHEMKADLSQKTNKLGSSIGHRIMKTMKNGNEKNTNKEPGSAVRSISKNTRPGSVFKKSSATKMPNFKKLHQNLFNNMESLSENKKRHLDRAEELFKSPVVRRCALLTPKAVKTTRGPHHQALNPCVKASAAPSPLAMKLKTPVASPTPKLSAPKPVRTPLSVNRFGFRKPVRKEEALNIVGKKMPSTHNERKKEQERDVLKGVRMNKRFMLQMKMRKMEKE